MTLSTFVRDLRAIWAFDNRWFLLAERFSELVFRHPLSLSIYQTGNMEILMDKSAGDQSGARYAITSPMYKQYLPYILGKLPPETRQTGLVVWDIGANVGGFSLMLALQKVVLKRVVAVEMHPRTFVRLRQNLEKNLTLSSKQLVCLNVAVGDRSETTMEMEFSKGNTGDSIVEGHLRDKGTTETHTIRLQTLDSVYAEAFPDNDIIDICKIDIESAEYEIFLGVHHHVLSRCRFLMIEIHPHPHYTFDIVVNAICNLQFQRILINSRTEEDIFFFENTQLN